MSIALGAAKLTRAASRVVSWTLANVYNGSEPAQIAPQTFEPTKFVSVKHYNRHGTTFFIIKVLFELHWFSGFNGEIIKEYSSLKTSTTTLPAFYFISFPHSVIETAHLTISSCRRSRSSQCGRLASSSLR